jgi:hypothetical protein
VVSRRERAPCEHTKRLLLVLAEGVLHTQLARLRVDERGVGGTATRTEGVGDARARGVREGPRRVPEDRAAPLRRARTWSLHVLVRGSGSRKRCRLPSDASPLDTRTRCALHRDAGGPHAQLPVAPGRSSLAALTFTAACSAGSGCPIHWPRDPDLRCPLLDRARVRARVPCPVAGPGCGVAAGLSGCAVAVGCGRWLTSR